MISYSYGISWIVRAGQMAAASPSRGGEESPGSAGQDAG